MNYTIYSDIFIALQFKTMNKKNDICPACECNPCDCGWGNYLKKDFFVARTFRKENYNKQRRKDKASRKKINKQSRQNQRKLLKKDCFGNVEVLNIETIITKHHSKNV